MSSNFFTLLDWHCWHKWDRYQWVPPLFHIERKPQTTSKVVQNEILLCVKFCLKKEGKSKGKKLSTINGDNDGWEVKLDFGHKSFGNFANKMCAHIIQVFRDFDSFHGSLKRWLPACLPACLYIKHEKECTSSSGLQKPVLQWCMRLPLRWFSLQFVHISHAVGINLLLLSSNGSQKLPFCQKPYEENKHKFLLY